MPVTKQTYVKPVAYSASSTMEANYATLTATSGGCGTVGISPGTTEFGRALTRHFGFGGSASHSIEVLWNAIARRGSALVSETSNDALASAYVFFRLLGGFVYGTGKNDEGKRWDYTAGKIDFSSNDMSEPNGVPVAERNYVVNTLGLSDNAYRDIRYQVRLQNQLSKNKSKEEYSADYLSKYRTAMQQNTSEGDFRVIWDHFTTSMTNKPDFAHMCIALATHLGSNFGYGHAAEVFLASSYFPATAEFGMTEAKNYFAGWLGDAVLIDNSGKTTFGADDYFADIDVLYLSRSLLTYNFNVPKCLSKYYDPYAQSSSPRRQVFQNVVGVNAAADVVGKCIIDYNAQHSVADVISTLQNSARYSDTARFFKWISGQDNEPSYQPYK